MRREGREWGTAVLSRVDGDRRRIYTARYMLAIKGKERGKFEASVQEVGSGPVEALAQLLQDAQRRIDDEQPPIPVPPEQWFAAAADGPASLAARARPSSSASAVISASITSRSPASAIWWPRSSSSSDDHLSVDAIRRAAQGAGRAGRHRDGLPHPRGAGGERTGPGARLRRGIQALRADGRRRPTTSI